MTARKRKPRPTSGPTILEPERIARGTGRVVSIRLAPADLAALDSLRCGESRSAAIVRLIRAAVGA